MISRFKLSMSEKRIRRIELQLADAVKTKYELAAQVAVLEKAEKN